MVMLLDRWGQQGTITGDVKSVGGGVYEARVHSGPGYRLYFAQKKDIVVVLLIGETSAVRSGTSTRLSTC